MTLLLSSWLTPWLRRLEPERAHRLAVLGLRLGLGGRETASDDPALAVRTLGLVLSNPIGLAAGFDKEAAAVRGLRLLGFGAIETGTVTPLPQPGNPRPRVFRLEPDRAVINRYGLNSSGLDAYVTRLSRAPRRGAPVGANVGINKVGADPERDYPRLVAAVAPHADYVVINVSSPNTPGLRDLQGEEALRRILDAVRQAVPCRPPLLVKVAPDLTEAGLEGVVEAAVDGGAEGLIVGNTTLARPLRLRSPLRAEAGGLSGPPLMTLSTRMLARAHALAAGRLVLVGCGGIASGADVLAKLRAGAQFVQLYTAFAYEGPALLGRLKRELLEAMRREGFRNVAEAVGTAQ
jgi:dihydroorotate dehydrogenase